MAETQLLNDANTLKKLHDLLEQEFEASETAIEGLVGVHGDKAMVCGNDFSDSK